MASGVHLSIFIKQSLHDLLGLQGRSSWAQYCSILGSLNISLIGKSTCIYVKHFSIYKWLLSNTLFTCIVQSSTCSCDSHTRIDRMPLEAIWGSASWRQLWYYSAFCFWHSTRVQIVVGLTWFSSCTGAQLVRAQFCLSYTQVNAIKLVINSFGTRPLGTFWMGLFGNWQSVICCQYCCSLSIWERSCLGFGLNIFQSIMNILKIVNFWYTFFVFAFNSLDVRLKKKRYEI